MAHFSFEKLGRLVALARTVSQEIYQPEVEAAKVAVLAATALRQRPAASGPNLRTFILLSKLPAR